MRGPDGRLADSMLQDAHAVLRHLGPGERRRAWRHAMFYNPTQFAEVLFDG
jgi:hypothetical protein